MSENKKIKSVKLAKYYRTQFKEIKAGTVLKQSQSNPEYFLVDDKTEEGINYSVTSFFHKKDILECNTGLFEVEYEDEHFKYSEKADSYSQGIVDTLDIYYKKFLNALADWCDRNNYINDTYKILIGYNNCKNILTKSEAHSDYTNYGTICLNSYTSANLFIDEINREENKAVKEYYIEMLKSKRLV